ncbi:extracellular calcium-sensing receptor-like [Conger conger]|uniref:extracellular calcium-sensing receptor-like n=1 Tax=Conger conger TaxID=82655 RepID=UPI002A5A3B57|nr:extracellular calcium-sensing receptor-like [Conger conger]
MLGGIFPVFNKEENRNVSFQKEPHGGNCVRFDLRAYRWAQVMMFTIKEINEDQSLLPNISLGYAIFDSCGSPISVLRAALTLLNGQEETKSAAECHPPVSAVIAAAGSSRSVAAAGALGPFSVPMVSYFSTCACLSDKIKYPTFFRTIPSDYHQAKALASLVRRFGWSWIGAIQADNDYGRNGVLSFTDEVKKFGVCIAFIGTVLRTYPRSKILDVVEMIKRSTVRVILAFVPEGDLYPLMQELVMQNITGIQWIASEAWITAARPSTIEIFRSFGGAIGFATRKMAMPKLKDFLVNIDPLAVQWDPFVRDFWETIVSDHLKRVNFVNSYGEAVFFDENGDPPPSYEIINWQLRNGIPKAVCTEICPRGSRKAQIKGKPTCCFDCILCAGGTIANTTGATDCIPCPLEYWSNKAKDQCIPKDIEFLSYHDGMGIALTVVSLSGVCLAFSTIVVFFNFKNTPIVKANNSELSFLLLFSLLLCFLCPLTFIGEPTVWSCMLRHTVFGITFALCISCVLGKTIVVVTAFRATLPNNNMARIFGPMQQRIIVCSCTTVQIFICLLWLTLNPPFPDRTFKQSDIKIILECNTGSETAFYAVLGYIGILSAACLVLAFLARKLPDNFNEAKFISFSMLIFCAVWLTFIPAYVSSPGKYTVAVEIFAILSSAFGLLFCIFAPKCYIILIKPEKNTRNNVMGKSIAKRS